MIKIFFKNHWISGLLILCILSACTTPALNLAVVGFTAGALLIRLIIRRVKTS